MKSVLPSPNTSSTTKAEITQAYQARCMLLEKSFEAEFVKLEEDARLKKWDDETWAIEEEFLKQRQQRMMAREEKIYQKNLNRLEKFASTVDTAALQLPLELKEDDPKIKRVRFSLLEPKGNADSSEETQNSINLKSLSPKKRLQAIRDNIEKRHRDRAEIEASLKISGGGGNPALFKQKSPNPPLASAEKQQTYLPN